MSRDRWENAITRAEAAETADERSAWIDLARLIGQAGEVTPEAVCRALVERVGAALLGGGVP